MEPWDILQGQNTALRKKVERMVKINMVNSGTLVWFLSRDILKGRISKFINLVPNTNERQEWNSTYCYASLISRLKLHFKLSLWPYLKPSDHVFLHFRLKALCTSIFRPDFQHFPSELCVKLIYKWACPRGCRPTASSWLMNPFHLSMEEV